MSDSTLRKMIVIIMASLLIHQAGSIVASLFGWAWGSAIAILVAAITFFSVRMAKASSTGAMWYMLPTLLFTIIPVGWMLWKNFHQTETGLFERLLNMSSFLIGFALPMALLFIIYLELRPRRR